MAKDKEKEKPSLVQFYGDGFWDIFLGSVFISGGLYTLSGSVLAYLFALAGLLALITGRFTITQARAAEINTPPGAAKRPFIPLILLLAVLFLIAALWFLPAAGILTQSTAANLILALVVPLVLAYLAYMLNFTRLYAYAILAALFMLTAQLISPTAGAWVQLLSGLIIVSSGLLQLNKFLKQ